MTEPDPQVIWQQTLDEGQYEGKVIRIDEDRGLLIVTDVSAGIAFSGEEVTLSYGAIFGPDVDDVAHWQEITAERVDEYNADD